MSETVKLIIEIPKSALELLNTTGVDWLGAEHILSAVAEGVPLDEVKAEIQKKYRDAEFMNEFIDGCNHTIGEVLEILDNIGKGDSE